MANQMKLVCGVGINDADYVVQYRVSGRRLKCPAHMAWANMLDRCYNAKFHSRHPSYIGVTVCDEWLSFMSFRKWWIDNHVDGWHLDKDLLTDGREYSPEACIYVPQWLNKFTLDRALMRGDWPIGVSFHRPTGKFRARCRNPMNPRGYYIGVFADANEAHRAWLKRKLELAKELKDKMDEIDERIYQRVIEIILSKSDI